MTPNTDPHRYDWHKDHPVVKLTALLIDRGCTMVERVVDALGRAAWPLVGLAGMAVVRYILF